MMFPSAEGLVGVNVRLRPIDYQACNTPVNPIKVLYLCVFGKLYLANTRRSA